MRFLSAKAIPEELPDGLPDGVQPLRATQEASFASTTSVRASFRPSQAEPFAQGSIVAQKFELIRKLGEGGMGSVWVAKNLTLDTHVALKLLRPGLSDDVPGAAERMQQEARAAACIAHPAIIQVFDFGKSEQGVPFIAMELLNGESLASLLARKQRLKPTRAAQTLLPIIDALAVAHERGIVHRDLKPDNIFLTRMLDGKLQPKILDFGIAKLEQKVAPKLTLEGTVLGSPAYMAPEQARGEAQIDARADIWALGVAFYESVTGACPFTGQNYQALLWAILGTEPKTLAEHDIDEPELWAIIARCLSKQRENRFPDMRALGAALAGFLVSRGVEEDITKAPLRPWLSPGAGAGEAMLSMFPAAEALLSMLPRSATPATVRSKTYGDAPPAAPEAPLDVPSEAPPPPFELSTRALGPVGSFDPPAPEPDAAAEAKAARGRTTRLRARPQKPWEGHKALWLVLAGVGATAAFAFAALSSPGESGEPSPRSVSTQEPPRSVPEPPEPREDAPRAAPVPTAHAKLADEPAEVAPRPAPVQAKPARGAPRPARAKQPARSSELKNPFADK
ncbi:MAG TPA: protein kinase [Polyangiaceae bacterium]